MPLYPYRIAENFSKHIKPPTVEVLEQWVNHGDGTDIEFRIEEWLFDLLCGAYARAASGAYSEDLDQFGWIIALLNADFPGTSFGSLENVRAWRGLIEEDETLTNT